MMHTVSRTIRSRQTSPDDEPTMSNRGGRIARAIKSFVENPITNLVKGLALLLIGLADASHTFRDDITHGHVRVGHGLIIIGAFSILGALPHLIDSMEAGERYFELREKRVQAEEGLTRTMSRQPPNAADPQTSPRPRPSDDKSPMRSLLAVTAAIEAATGVALMIAPPACALALLGSPLDPAAGSVIGRVLGAALLSLGTACGLARVDAPGQAATGLVTGLLLYNVAIIAMLGHARLGLGISGLLLWPAVFLHALLGAWCVPSLRIVGRTSASRSTRDHPR